MQYRYRYKKVKQSKKIFSCVHISLVSELRCYGRSSNLLENLTDK